MSMKMGEMFMKMGENHNFIKLFIILNKNHNINTKFQQHILAH